MTGTVLSVDAMDTTGAPLPPELSAEWAKRFAYLQEHPAELVGYHTKESTYSLDTAGLERDVAARYENFWKRGTESNACLSYEIDTEVRLAYELMERLIRLALAGREAAEPSWPCQLPEDIPVDLQVTRLVARCKCPEPTRLRTFLNSNVYLIDLVDEALRRLKGHFPREHFILSIEDDPDSYEPEKLVCFVRTQQNVEEAETAYDKFRDEWWLDAIGLAEDRFSIVVEYE